MATPVPKSLLYRAVVSGAVTITREPLIRYGHSSYLTTLHYKNQAFKASELDQMLTLSNLLAKDNAQCHAQP